jgi:1-acyl-sn-glycerol-3-phosphate acyltransferase
MPVLYRTLRPLVRFGLEFFFVEIRTVGSEAIPAAGPLIVAANHPSSLMDTALLSTRTARPIHWMARSGLFEPAWAGALLRRMGAIPVYRAEDTQAGHAPDNARAFRAVFDLLAAGGCIGIFPEGRNSPDAQVAPLRTGLARIALGVEAEHDFALGVQVVPVGIHFEKRDRFFTSVLLRVGRPLRAADWRAAWEADPAAAVRALTDEVQRALRREALHVEDDLRHALVQDLTEAVGERLIDQLLVRLQIPRKGLRRRIFDQIRAQSTLPHDLDDRYQIRQFLGDLVTALQKHEPATLDELQRRTDLYMDHAAQLRLRHATLLDPDAGRTSRVRSALRFTAYLVACFPAAAWGIVHHALPGLLTRLAAWRTTDPAQRAITLFGAAFVLFPVWYLAEYLVLRRLLGWGLGWTLLHLTTLPAFGFFWMRYIRQLLRHREAWLARTLLRDRAGVLTDLARERRALVLLVRAAAERLDVRPPGEAAALGVEGG